MFGSLAVGLFGAGAVLGQTLLDTLPRLDDAQTVAENALWLETPLQRQFQRSKQVTIAELTGPAVITMIHFALPERMIAQPDQYRLGRELLLRMYWDGEPTPSVDCPLVDFFCDPDGQRDRLQNALVNKKRGWNAYFPMPFRKSARIELVYDGPLPPGRELWRSMPCYSYVIAQRLPSLPEDVGYFHAQWRQQLLNLGKEDYVALEAGGRGKCIGWNVTVRLPGRGGYPVDENEQLYIDGQETPAVEFQGIEDAFGFSWGFPPEENLFPLTGYFPFHKEGAAAYRFFLQDAIRFQRSLKITIGFGEKEDPQFRKQFGKPGNELEFSSTVYWYQTEPHAPFPPMPPAERRRPRDWKDLEKLPSPEALEKQGVKLHFRCGSPKGNRSLSWGRKGINLGKVAGRSAGLRPGLGDIPPA